MILMYICLAGLHPEEAVEYLERTLLENATSSQPLYAITGTGHHSKNGKDKVQRAIRLFLDEWKYAYREFSAQGDRGGMGGILGIDPRSFDRSSGGAGAGGGGSGVFEMGGLKEILNGGNGAYSVQGERPVNADGEILAEEGVSVPLVAVVKETKRRTPPIKEQI